MFSKFIKRLRNNNNTKLIENINLVYLEGLVTDHTDWDGGAGFMFICPKTRRILIGKRTKDNKWADFGGGKEKSETPLETAIREVSEELQFYPDQYIILPNPLKNIEDDGYVFYNFLATTEDEIIPDINEEHSETRWVSLSEIKEYDLIDGMVNIFSDPINVQRVINTMDEYKTSA